MDFGKLADISVVDFTMPPNPQRTKLFLNALHGSGRLLLGATAWADRQFVGRLYPTGTKPTNYLKEYARQFDTVELNSTHYSIPTFDQLEKWKGKVPVNFRFCPKIPQSISHRKDLGLQSGLLQAYLDVIPTLEPVLGLQFMQISPRFGPELLPTLEQFFQLWPRQLPLAMEFRHPDWFTTDEGWALLQQYGIGTVITDVSGRRDVLHMRLTAPFVMVRFVGNALHPTDFERLSDWVTRVKHWVDEGMQVYFMPHQPELPELITMCFKAAKAMQKAGLDCVTLRSYASGEQQSLF